MKSSDRYSNLQCYEDFETAYRDVVTRDPSSTPYSHRQSMRRSFHVSNMMAIHNVIQKGWVEMTVPCDA